MWTCAEQDFSGCSRGEGGRGQRLQGGGAGIGPDVVGTRATAGEVGEEGIRERDMWEVGWQRVGKGRRCILTPKFLSRVS